MRSWRTRRWGVALLVTVATMLVIGVPTDVVPTPLYARMTPVTWWNTPVAAVTAALTGLVAATYVRSPLGTASARRVAGGPLLGLLAVGCPICNKAVVALIGMSGALNVWAPLQPVLAVVGMTLLATALFLRLRGERSCALPSGAAGVAIDSSVGAGSSDTSASRASVP